MGGHREFGPDRPRTDAEYLLNIHNRLALLSRMPYAAASGVRDGFRLDWLPRLQLVATGQLRDTSDPDNRTWTRWATELVGAWADLDAGEIDDALEHLRSADAIRLFPRGHG